MVPGMVGKAFISGLFATTLAATPALAQEAKASGRASETCLKVSFDGDYKIEIPCPPGARRRLEQLPRPADPAPRHDIVIDPEWPHDQAMATEPDWPHDSAMIAPRAEEAEEAIPLFDELLGAIERDELERQVRRLLEGLLSGKSK